MLTREAIFPLLGLPTTPDSSTGLNKSAAVSAAPLLPTALGALLVAVSYYAGSELGFFLKPAHTAIATFWPPSAILLAAFLLAPTQRWWVFLLAVFPAHLLVQMDGSTTLLAALRWFMANTCGPLLGAAFIRRLKKDKTLFDGLQGIVVFLTLGAVLPPLVKSLLNALAAIDTSRGSDYWMLWTAVLFSNIVSNLILVPTIVIAWRDGISWFRRAEPGRYVEAGALAAAAVGLSFLIFNGGNAWSNIPLVIFAPLLLLFWAAIRFGVGGVSASLLGVGIISIWNTIHGQWPIGTSLMAHDPVIYRVLLLHGVLMIFGFPFIVTAALITERCGDTETLEATRRNLIYVQQQGNHRIARKLHRDIVGQLTLISIGVDQIRSESNTTLRPIFDELYDKISLVFRETIDLSSEIHPFMVEYLGLAAALRKLCRETGAQSGVSISFSDENLPRSLPSDVANGLFRVAKEALQNVSQHSQAKTAKVELKATERQVLLRISDDGIGMGSQQGEGLGLTYMREQTLSLGGTFKISSVSSRGTFIETSVPIKNLDLCSLPKSP
jgi:signal transduction histidine kinase